MAPVNIRPKMTYPIPNPANLPKAYIAVVTNSTKRNMIIHVLNLFPDIDDVMLLAISEIHYIPKYLKCHVLWPSRGGRRRRRIASCPFGRLHGCQCRW